MEFARSLPYAPPTERDGEAGWSWNGTWTRLEWWCPWPSSLRSLSRTQRSPRRECGTMRCRFLARRRSVWWLMLSPISPAEPGQSTARRSSTVTACHSNRRSSRGRLIPPLASHPVSVSALRLPCIPPQHRCGALGALPTERRGRRDTVPLGRRRACRVLLVPGRRGRATGRPHV